MLDVIPEKVAVIFVDPGVKVISVASPCEPGVLLIGISRFEEAQVTDVVKSSKFPFDKNPVAVNC